MEVIQKLNISAKHVYDKVIESVQYDIMEQTGQTISPSELKGFKYLKKFGNYSSANIEIVDIEEEKKYHFITKTTNNTFDTLYEIQTIDDNSCQVRYVEAIKSSGFIQKLNDMLIEIIVGMFKKKRIKGLLQEIERSALDTVQ